MRHIEAHGISVEQRTQLGESDEVPSGVDAVKRQSLDTRGLLEAIVQSAWKTHRNEHILDLRDEFRRWIDRWRRFANNQCAF